MIFHIAPLGDWLSAPGRPYASPSLATEGFVHCSPDEEVTLAVANAFYREVPGPLVVLVIDERALDAEVRWEGEGTRFPHVYGPVDRSAVTGLLDVERDADGRALNLRESNSPIR